MVDAESPVGAGKNESAGSPASTSSDLGGTRSQHDVWLTWDPVGTNPISWIFGSGEDSPSFKGRLTIGSDLLEFQQDEEGLAEDVRPEAMIVPMKPILDVSQDRHWGTRYVRVAFGDHEEIRTAWLVPDASGKEAGDELFRGVRDALPAGQVDEQAAAAVAASRDAEARGGRQTGLTWMGSGAALAAAGLISFFVLDAPLFPVIGLIVGAIAFFAGLMTYREHR